MSQGYNGWTNYETWAVNLWISNDQGSAADLAERAEEAYREAVADAVFSRTEVAAQSLTDSIKEEYESAAETMLDSASATNSLWADLINAALSEVDWYEIALAAVNELDVAEIDGESVEE